MIISSHRGYLTQSVTITGKQQQKHRVNQIIAGPRSLVDKRVDS